MILIVFISVLIARHVYTRELREAARELRAIDGLLAEQTAQAFRGAAMVQGGVLEELTSAGFEKPADLARLAGDREMHDHLRQRISGVPQLEAIAIADWRGDLVNLSRLWPVPRFNLSQRPYFKVLSAANAPRSALAEPVKLRGTSDWNIPLAWRLSATDGSFAGVVVAGLRTEYFEHVYQSLNLPAGSSVGLWREDGLSLAHYPASTAVGTPRSPDWGLSGAPAGRIHVRLVPAHLGDAARLVASIHLVDPPIVVAVGRSMRAVFGNATLDLALLGAADLGCLLGVALLTHLLIRQFRGYELAAATLRARERAERDLRDAEALLLRGQKLESINRLTSGVAHDFNNLLTVVRANAEMLGRGAEDPKTVRRLTAVMQAADRGAVLTRQMLAFSRQQILTPTALDLGQALGSISELLRASVGAQIRLETRAPDDPWLAYADAAQMEQAVLNLVFNARDAIAHDGAITIEIANVHLATSAEGLSPGDYVAVTVRDTGAGMTPEVMAQAFEPFFTTKQQGKGTGLGLSQVIGFARQSGGDVSLESHPGEGTAVRILLPRARDD